MYARYLIQRVRNTPSKLWDVKKINIINSIFRNGKYGEHTQLWSIEMYIRLYQVPIVGDFQAQHLKNKRRISPQTGLRLTIKPHLETVVII